MTRDEARKLLAAYATGSLTDAEGTALFEAALEDQELFDELAGEQVLKEILDEPGARQRLLAALEPPGHRAWLWGWAGAAATLAIVVGVVVFNRTPPPPQQIAQVTKSPEPVATPATPIQTPPPPAPVARKVAPLPAPPPPAPPPKPPVEERAQRADKLEADASARGAAVGGFAGARAAAAAAPVAENLVAKVAGGFAFNYAVRADGFLQIVPLAPGFLSVTTSINGNDAVVFPSGAVSAGMLLRIPIPSEATSLVIRFSGTEGIAGSPVRRNEASGTVTDQDPPNRRIIIQLFLTPATQ